MNPMKIKNTLLSVSILLLLLGAATGIGYVFRYAGFPETNIVIVYILSVLLAAMYMPTYTMDVASSLAATLTFNFFFTEPLFTFSVNDPGYIITFIIMTITALITSTLTSRVKKSIRKAQEKEAEANALYKLTNRLTDAADIEGITYAAVSTISDILSCKAGCLCFGGLGTQDCVFLQQTDSGKPARRDTPDAKEIKKRIESLHTAFDAGEDFFDYPIYGREATLGIIRIPAERARQFSEKQKKTLHSMIENTALAMDSFYIAQKQLIAREETERERYRGNLLRAISHDLRTPLAGILGSSRVLKDMAADKEAVVKIAGDIYEEADWLHSLVENILNLTRLQDGKLLPKKEPEAAEEIIGFAVGVISRRYPSVEIAVFAPEDLLVIPMDARLISQVLINLLDNAVKHTRSNNGIAVTVTDEGSFARFVVSDEGTGIHEDVLPSIFEMFYTAEKVRADAHHGIGLGLTICKAIINAHGGEIIARNRDDRQGAEIIFTLPMEAKEGKEIQNGNEE